MPRAVRAAVVAAACLASAGVTAGPRDTSAEARQQLAELEADVRASVHALRYAEARVAAEAALALGAAGRGDVARLARALGEITAALDDPAAAERWFSRWLELDPRGELPPGSSPKLTAPLAAARRRLGGALATRIVLEPIGAGQRWRIQVRVDGDPGALAVAAALTLRGPDGGRSTEDLALPAPGPGRGPLAVERTFPGLIAVEVSIRDRHGNELDAGAAPVARREPDSSPSIPRPLWRRPWPYAAAAGVAAGLGGVLAWRRTVAVDDLDRIVRDSARYTFADAEAARARAERHGWSSVAGFATAGALAAAAIYLAAQPERPGPVEVSIIDGGVVVHAVAAF